MTDAKDPRAARAIDRFFDEEVLPAATRLKAAGVALIETRIDPQADSYYRRRVRTAMAAEDFRWGGARDEAQIATDLARLWADRPQAEWQRLAPGVARLAQALRRQDDQTADLADFIYVMY